MAKLNGVKAVAEAIEHNGTRYEKIDETPKAGDILRVDESGYLYVTEGAYYEVDHVDNSDDPQIIDDDGDVFDGADVEYTLFRKVSEPQAATQQYREVKRPAEEGERIKIVEPYMAYGRYKKGDEFIVRAVYRSQPGARDYVNVENLTIAILDREYVVLEPIAEQADDIIEVDGVKYRKVDRAPKVGDFVYMIKSGTDLTMGKIYEVYSLYSDGTGRFRDDVGDTRCFSRNSTTRQLVVRIATAEDLERQVSELQTKLSEVEAELAAKKAEEEAAKRLKVGEYAKVIGGNNFHTKIGDVVIIRSVDSDGDYEINSLDGRELGGFKFAENLVRATDEEVAEAKRKLELSKFTEGTHVRLTVEEGKDPKHGWGGVKNGAVGVVNEVYGSVVKVDFPGFSRWNADPSELTILTAEEAEEVAKWAAIGRKVGEFKDGDLIEITRYQNGDKVGTIAPVTDIYSDAVYYKARNSGALEFRGDKDAIKLVAPVESVVNLTVSI